MKTLTSNMSTYLASAKTNVEPVIILQVDWSGDGQAFMYADKDISSTTGDIEGKILAVGSLESLLSSKAGNSNSLQFTLDDTDGTIKTLLDVFDPYGKPCIVYQYFDDTSLTVADKILMFKGRVNYDVTWDEGERTVTFTILTKIEEREVGFSPEEGQFDFVAPDAVGKPWPLCFGSPIHVPTALITSANVGTLNDQICFVDPLLVWKRIILYEAIIANYSMYNYYQEVALSSQAVQGYTAQSMLSELLDALRGRKDLIIQYNALLAEINDLKRELWLAIRGRATREPKDIRTDISTKQAEKRVLEDNQIGQVHGTIELLTNLVPTLEASIQQRSNALDKQYEAIGQMSKLYQEYLAVDLEICKQQQCVTDTVHVRDGENFPQDTVVDVFINNLRFRGTFSNDVFTIDSMLPKYQAIDLAPREALTDDCAPDQDQVTFWVQDESIQLAGLYILVKSSRDGNNHIVKVDTQEGRKCTIEPVPYSYRTQADEIAEQVNWTAPSVAVGVIGTDNSVFQHNPGYPSNFFGSSSGFNWATNLASSILPVTRPEYMTSLGGLPFDVSTYLSNNSITLNETTYQMLLKLSKIRERDNQLYIVQFAGLFPNKAYTLTTYDIDNDHIIEASPVILTSWLTDKILVDELPDTASWSAGQGATIIDADNSCQIRVANIIPSTTVHSVSAFRTFEEHKALVTVPTRYYTEQEETLGALTLRTIRTHLPLSALQEGWEDDIYVTQTSSVGPNVVDVIQHLVETYTDKTVDTDSFDEVHDLVDAYPVHFALLNQKNVFEQINEIALQARCVVYVVNDVYYIKYLGVEPDAVATLTETDVIQGSMLITYTDLTEIVTRLTAFWNKDYSGQEKEPYKVVLRHNIAKYGLHESEQTYYIYNVEELVKKSATFWLIRNCNSWKRVVFDVNLEHLNLETFDAVMLDLPHISNSPVKALVEDTNYNTDQNNITLSLWLPILSGKMVPDTFAWPGSADADDEYALDNEDVGSGNALISGTLPDCL